MQQPTDQATTAQQPIEPTKIDQVDHLVISAKLLKQLMHAAAVDDIRYYLHGIFVDAENKALVATNGHVIVKYDMPHLNFKQNVIIRRFSIPKHASKKHTFVFKVNHSRKTIKAELVNNNNVSSAGEYLEWLEGKYVNYIDVFSSIKEKPKHLTSGSIGFMTHVVKHIAKTFPQTDEKIPALIKLEFFGEQEEILVTSPDYENLIMIAMPAISKRL